MRKPKPAPLSGPGAAFCQGVAEFCDRHDITVRRFSQMVGGDRSKFGPSTAHGFLHGKLFDDTVDRVRPAIAAAFVQYLEDRGFTAAEIESELSSIFDPQEYTKMIANRCDLTLPARRYFNFTTNPFDVDLMPLPGEVFLTPEIEDVVQAGVEAVMYRKFVAFIGPVGSGKTLLKNLIAHRLEQLHKGSRLLHPEFFNMEEVNVGGIASQILTEFGQVVPREKPKRVLAIKDMLVGLHKEGLGCALMMDECHRLHDKVLSSLKNFWELNDGSFSRLLGVVLFGQPQFVDDRLRQVKFKEIRQRLQVIKMPDFDSLGPAYIKHRLDLAGREVDELFEPAAVARICHNASSPLAIGNLCNAALMSAFEKDQEKVTVDLPFFKTLTAGAGVVNMRRAG